MAHHNSPAVIKHVLPLLPFLVMMVLCTFPAGCFLPDSARDIDVKNLEGLMQKDKRLLLVDNRTTLEYASGRIPGAIHIPQEEFYRMGSLLPPEKDTPIVFYCRGYG